MDPFAPPKPSRIERWRQRWRNYTGDRQLELAIRAKLKQEGFRGHGAQILDTRLIAIERPGWVQVYQFRAETKDFDERPRKLWGAARIDERSRTEIALFEAENLREIQVDTWSQGLLRTHRRKRSPLEWVLVGSFLVVLGLAIISFLSRQG